MTIAGKIKPWMTRQTERLDNLLRKNPFFAWPSQPGVMGPVIMSVVRNAAIASAIIGWLHSINWLFFAGVFIIFLNFILFGIFYLLFRIAIGGFRELLSYETIFYTALILPLVGDPFTLLIMVLTLILKGIYKVMRVFSGNDNLKRL